MRDVPPARPDLTPGPGRHRATGGWERTGPVSYRRGVPSRSSRPNKQKRQRQNRAEREARAAKRANAGEATNLAADGGAPASGAGSRPSSSRTTPKAGDAKAARAQARAERRSRLSQHPGQRAVFLAFLFTLVSALTLLISDVPFPRDVEDRSEVPESVDEGDVEENDDGTFTYLEDGRLLDEVGPAATAGLLFTPIAITGAAVWFTSKPQRSNAWTICMILLAGYIFFLARGLSLLTLPALVALAIGGFQSRRAETKERMAEIRAGREERAGGGEVIDAEATEVEPDAGDEGDGADADLDGSEEPDDDRR